MTLRDIFLRVVILTIGCIVVAIDLLLYNSCEKQKIATEAMVKQQQVETQVSDNKFKYQQGQVERISNDLQNIERQVKAQMDSLAQQKDAASAQKNALLEEIEKRQQIENESTSVQVSLVDIKAEADAIKQDIKTWQKDYVSVLAQLDKKTDDVQGEIKGMKEDLEALRNPHPTDNSALPLTK